MKKMISKSKGVAVAVMAMVMLIYIPVAAQTAGTSRFNRYAADNIDLSYFANIQGNGVMAFGDDSYHVFKDFRNALGFGVSLSLGKKFSDIFSARLKLREMQMYSRVNLEGMAANVDEHPELYPRDGFYGYNGFAFQAEGMLNLAHFVDKNHPDRPFNVYLLLGGGVNVMSSYDPVVEKWKPGSGYIDNGTYVVDTDSHTMPCAAIGGQLEYKINRYVGVNVEALCTFTLDNMEGVVSEEFYDAYVTASAGLTIYF